MTVADLINKLASLNDPLAKVVLFDNNTGLESNIEIEEGHDNEGIYNGEYWITQSNF